jgi:hypothetical protein
MKSDKLGNTKKYITFVDLPSGERFEFAYPGAYIGTFKNFICGWSTDGRFRMIRMHEIEAAWTSERIDLQEIDTLSVITRAKLLNGEKIVFDESGASFHFEEQCVKGTALNGEIVTLPVSRIEQGEAFKNFKAVEASNGFKVFFALIGIIGILALKVAVAIQEQSN